MQPLKNIVDRSGGILVRDPKKGFVPVDTPIGFTDLEFRNTIAAAYTHYRATGKLPTVDDLAEINRAITKKTYSSIILTDEFKKALSYRGVEWNNEAGLTLEQQSVLIKLQDFTDRRSLGVKLRELGVPMARYQAWLKHPLFRKAMNDAAENVLSEAVAPALLALSGKAAAGEDRAIEKLLEISGRWNPNAQSVEDARVVVMTLLEAIIKHVPDADVRKAIMSEVSLAAGTLEALNP